MAAPSQDEINKWSSSIGLDPCIGTAYVADNGVLPPTMEALNSWGTKTGRRASSGAWSCTPTTPAPSTTPGGVTPSIPGGSGWASDINVWLGHNWPLVAVGFGGAIVFKKLFK